MAQEEKNPVRQGPVKDPVCGMSVKSDTPYKMKREDRKYFFCSAECMEQFRKEPKRYAA